jgi:hypothetical protein
MRLTIVYQIAVPAHRQAVQAHLGVNAL